MEQFIWKGRLRVLEIGDRCDIRLEVSHEGRESEALADRKDASTGELFAQVSYASPWNQVEPVLDSSRYFVLRVEGDGGKRAYIGMGFAERGDAFDFQVSSSILAILTEAMIKYRCPSHARALQLISFSGYKLTLRSHSNQSQSDPLHHPPKTLPNHLNQPHHQKTTL